MSAKQAALPKKEKARAERIGNLIQALEKRLYIFESGPTGNGPSGTIIANSTGCSSVYASTFPYNAYNDPWVNSLFQDAQPLAKGIFDGISAQLVDDVRKLRIARLELDDAYEPEKHDAELRYLSWGHFTPHELDLLPIVMTIGGDGASYDIGFGALSRILASNTPNVRKLRIARLELDDAYEPEKHDAELRYLSWGHFTPHELDLLPIVMTIGGDGASYDIGFGALSRILASNTPIKMLVLNTGVYSNTGGQASTSSFIGQDSDLSRIGAAHSGKHESRKELGLIASFHSNVFVCSTSTSLQNHYLKNALQFLTYNDAPALLDVYTPCQGEHGIADNIASLQSRLAVESRMNSVFVHDPRRGKNLHDWFSLDGNPDPEKDWTTTTLEFPAFSNEWSSRPN